jgi:hypothetical protein
MAGLTTKAEPKLRADRTSKDGLKVMAGWRAMADHPKQTVCPTVMAELRAMDGSKLMVHQKSMDDLRQKVC